MLSVFRRQAGMGLFPELSTSPEMKAELTRSRAAEAELHRAMDLLEDKIARATQELAGANADLAREVARCKEVEAQFAAIGAAVPYGAWIYSLDGIAWKVSSLYLELVGATKEEVKNHAWFAMIHEEDRARVQALWENTVAEQRNWDCEFRVVSKEGEVRHLLSRGAPLIVPNQEVNSYAGFQLDITDRIRLRGELMRLKSDLEKEVESKTEKLREANRQLLLELADRIKTEIALRDSEHQLRAMFENALDGMVLLNSDRQVLDANESALELFDYSLEELRRLRWDDLIPDDRQPGMDARWNRLLESGTRRGEMDVRRSNGGSRLVAFSSRAHILPDRHLMTLKDITDHREAEDSLRLLSHRLMRLQDEERRRIARELHDSTGQELAALRLHLDRIAAAGPLPEKTLALVREAEQICQSCTADVRTISYLLHPPMLDEVGLLPALEWYVSGFSERSGVKVTKEISEPKRPLSMELNTALFRIIQEALVNIHKHAESKEAKIRLSADGGQVLLEIRDHGKGIHPARVSRYGGNNENGLSGLGVGLTGMRERVRQLGGTLEILAANPGTLIRAVFPVDSKGSDGGQEWGKYGNA